MTSSSICVFHFIFGTLQNWFVWFGASRLSSKWFDSWQTHLKLISANSLRRLISYRLQNTLMKNWYFHQHKQPLSDIHSISQNETIYQAKWTKSDLSKNSELNDYLWKSQRNQATSNPISSLIQSIHLSIIIPLPHHSSNEMRSLHVSSRIAEIQTNNQSSSSNSTVSIPPCKPASASLSQFSVCRWVLASRWIIPN